MDEFTLLTLWSPASSYTWQYIPYHQVKCQTEIGVIVQCSFPYVPGT